MVFAGRGVGLKARIAEHVPEVGVGPVVELEQGPEDDDGLIEFREGPGAL